MLWIDVVNEPHVRLWRRFLRRYPQEVLVTVRRKGPLVELARRLLGQDFLVVGRWGRTKEEKLRAFAERVRELAELVDELGVSAATSKGSADQARVAFGLGIPFVALNDNDLPPHVITRLTFPLSTVAVVPECFRGPTYGPTLRFKGVFEVSHVLDYLEEPTKEEHRRLGLREGGYVIVRPPPVRSHYLDVAEHFEDAVRRLIRSTGLDEVRMPREGGIILPDGSRYEGVVDGLDLISTSAGVLSGGGTMIREAALLGIPAISFFPREEPCVTEVLMREGLIVKAREDTVIKAYDRLLEDMSSGELERRATRFLKSVGDPLDTVTRALEEAEKS
ncbi:MAG: DUF354 domain-containing protein [Candidatus Korarchaeota archaeon]|nr:DUF354 domain-containing protein [Candidatus Korarchaeota archaeon]